LDEAVAEAADSVTDDFQTLLADGYAEEEIEAVLVHQNCGPFEFFSSRNVRDVWTRVWLPENEQRHSGSIPIQKGKTA
jgi:hypothetical protein